LAGNGNNVSEMIYFVSSGT